jgi:membrane-bound inhibitor of C-type lysozyme
MRPSLATRLPLFAASALAVLVSAAAPAGEGAPALQPPAGETTPALPPVINAVFACEDGRQIEAAFHTREPQRVVLTLGRRNIELPLAPSASGARYSDGVTTFWNKGDQATFAWANGSTSCRSRR